MVETLKAIGDFFSTVWRYLGSVYDQIVDSIASLYSAWNYFNDFFLPGAPSFVITLCYSAFGLIIFAIIASVFRGRS